MLVNEKLVKEGFARSSPYPPDLKHQERLDKAEDFAREESIGLWNTCGGVDNAQTNQSSVSKSECQIKGNISSSGEKIYHAPGQKYYAKTVIDESRGERWFCSEKEAIDALWRKSKI